MSSIQMLSFSFLLLGIILHHADSLSIDSIYQFGDSVSDTGNFIIENSRRSFASSPPYGNTFFHRPTGRFSDGLLIVDFLAKAFHLPLLEPYLKKKKKKKANFVHGVNFAVAGSSAIDTSALALMNVTGLETNSSVSVQLEWFTTHLNTLCSSEAECKHRLRRAVFIVGETGLNDYAYALARGQSIKDVYKLVPNVVRVIKNAVKEVIHHGAVQVVVPGIFALGCAPVSLVNFASNDSTRYDKYKCIKPLNELVKYHNHKLKVAVKDLKHQNPSVSVSYGDVYSAFEWLLRNAASLGFEKNGVLKACCGEGNNAYNFNDSRPCGSQGVSACTNPMKRVSGTDATSLTRLTSTSHVGSSNTISDASFEFLAGFINFL